MNDVCVKDDVFYLSRYPIPLTPGEVESLLKQLDKNDQAAKKIILCLIEHRLEHRYIRPLLHIPTDYKSGFLMMAAACLLIETLQTFYDGKNESKDDNEDKADKVVGSEVAFIRFFLKNDAFFPNLRTFFPLSTVKERNGKQKQKCKFYKQIRCGILHQAETTGACRILREGPLFSRDANSIKINADLFVKAVNDSLIKYIDLLRVEDCSSHLWKMARQKLGYVCKNCQR